MRLSSPACLLFTLFALVSLLHGGQPAPFRFQAATVSEGFDRPVGMDLAPDGRLFVIELSGRVLLVDPTTGA